MYAKKVGEHPSSSLDDDNHTGKNNVMNQQDIPKATARQVIASIVLLISILFLIFD